MNVFLFGAKEKYIDIKDRLPLMAVGDRSQGAPSLDSEKKKKLSCADFVSISILYASLFLSLDSVFSQLGYGFNEESVVVNRGRPRATRANQSVPPSTPAEMWVQFQRIRQHPILAFTHVTVDPATESIYTIALVILNSS
jgi:hypothetical protein